MITDSCLPPQEKGPNQNCFLLYSSTEYSAWQMLSSVWLRDQIEGKGSPQPIGLRNSPPIQTVFHTGRCLSFSLPQFVLFCITK